MTEKMKTRKAEVTREGIRYGGGNYTHPLLWPFRGQKVTLQKEGGSLVIYDPHGHRLGKAEKRGRP